jgi:hypothetical protein
MGVTVTNKWKKQSHFILNNGKEVDYDRALKLKQEKKNDDEIYRIITDENRNNERLLRQPTVSEGGEEKVREVEKSAQLSLDKAKYILEHQDFFTKKEVTQAKKVITSL